MSYTPHSVVVKFGVLSVNCFVLIRLENLCIVFIRMVPNLCIFHTALIV